MFRILIVIAFVWLPSVAFAQTQPAPDAPAAASGRCLLAGKSFSTGTTIRASAQVDICDTSGAWVATDTPTAGCFFADNFYSVGATSAVSGAKSLIETCGADGTWSASPVKD